MEDVTVPADVKYNLISTTPTIKLCASAVGGFELVEKAVPWSDRAKPEFHGKFLEKVFMGQKIEGISIVKLGKHS